MWRGGSTLAFLPLYPPLDICTMTTDPEKAAEEATEIEVELKAGLPSLATCIIHGGPHPIAVVSSSRDLTRSSD